MSSDKYKDTNVAKQGDLAADEPSTDDLAAEEKYQRYKLLDPFPNIPPALLNSAHIEKYIDKAVIISPFYRSDLRSAIYVSRIVDNVLIFKHKNDYSPEYIDGNKEWIFFANSIAYININVYFRLPDYIAVRFNLRGKHIHRGLLLGTGPLVNPGYRGRILIPVHNLTNNDYIIEPNDEIIAIEFTKISPISTQVSEYEELDFEYIPNKNEATPDSRVHLREALNSQGTRTVISSMAGVREQFETRTEDARRAAKTAENWVKIGISLPFIVAAGIAISSFLLITNVDSDLRSSIKDVDESLIKYVNKLEEKISELKLDIERLKQVVLENTALQVRSVMGDVSGDLESTQRGKSEFLEGENVKKKRRSQ